MRGSSILATALAVATSGGAMAQYVTNAIGTRSSQVNVLAPQMLAKIIDVPSVIVLNAFPVASLLPVVSVTADVFIRPAGATDLLPAHVTSAAPSEVTFVVPAGVPYGSAELMWRTGTNPFKWINVKVAHSNLELSAGPTGLTTPAKPGQIISLVGSGLGYGAQVTATVGAEPAKVMYAGHGSPAGYDQFQIELPATVFPSCYVPVAISLGESSATSTISVSPDGTPCAHPLHLSLLDLRNLDAGGTLETLTVNASTNLAVTSATAVHRADGVTASLEALSATDLSARFSPPAARLGCFSDPAGSGTPTAAFRSGDFWSGTADTTTLTLRGPQGSLTADGFLGNYWSFVLPAPIDGTLAAIPTSVLASGPWVLSTPGSPMLQASSIGFTMPAPVQINGTAPVTFRRDMDQIVSWNGTAFRPDALASLFLQGHGTGAANQNLFCNVAANAGTLTVPASSLAAFRPTSLGVLTLQVITPPQPAGAPVKRTDGSPVAAIANYVSTDMRPVEFQ